MAFKMRGNPFKQKKSTKQAVEWLLEKGFAPTKGAEIKASDLPKMKKACEDGGGIWDSRQRVCITKKNK